MTRLFNRTAELFADSMSQIVNLEKIKSEQLISLIIVILPQLKKKEEEEKKPYGNVLRMMSSYCIHDMVIYSTKPAEQLSYGFNFPEKCCSSEI